MRGSCLRFFLLGTFLFWGTGIARFAHEHFEHHGRDGSAGVDEDDDDSVAAAFAIYVAGPTHLPDQKPDAHSQRPCVICQMLTAMSADRAAPPALPQPSGACVASEVVVDRAAPSLAALFSPPARGPPASV